MVEDGVAVWGWQRTKRLRMYEIGEFFVFLPVSSDCATRLALFGRLDFRGPS